MYYTGETVTVVGTVLQEPLPVRESVTAERPSQGEPKVTAQVMPLPEWFRLS